VVVAPYFLSKGRHIQDDIPALVAAAQEQFPNITCSIAEPIGGWAGALAVRADKEVHSVQLRRVLCMLVAKQCPCSWRAVAAETANDLAYSAVRLP
jgi:sirohydrochlorin ferrochelatase